MQITTSSGNDTSKIPRTHILLPSSSPQKIQTHTLKGFEKFAHHREGGEYFYTL